jgi:hypothetical protein
MKRWPAFSLVEIAIVLMITGMLLTGVPALMNFYKIHQTKQQIDLAIKSLGACVAKNFPLPQPDLPRTDGEFILRGTLPYKKLGIKRKGPAIQYAVDRVLTEDKSRIHSDFCNMDLQNHFATDHVEKDITAFELSVDKIKVTMTRNNFVAQYCGMVCHAPAPKKSSANETLPLSSEHVAIVQAKKLSPEELAIFGDKSE